MRRCTKLVGTTTAWIVLVAAASCGAPQSAPAQGPVGDAVQSAIDSGSATFDHAEWNRLLEGGTRDGLVDYEFMREHRGELDAYLERVARANLAALDGDHLMALLMNAYNAITVRAILDASEGGWVGSIRDIDDVWKKHRHTVGSHQVTLDEIEHNLLRPFWKDPRIHFGVNCASMSCAPLPPWAFTGDEVDEQLERLTRDFLTDPDNVRIDGDTLAVSKYFDWYGDDFTADGWEPRAESIPAFIARYGTDEVKAMVERGDPDLRFMDYDWSLNQAG